MLQKCIHSDVKCSSRCDARCIKFLKKFYILLCTSWILIIILFFLYTYFNVKILKNHVYYILCVLCYTLDSAR